MRKDFGAKTWLFPMPVLMIGTYDENGNPDLMNAAWGGIHDEGQIGICLSPGHKTTKNLLRSKSFTVSMGTADTVAECDYLGLVSGNEVPDKIEKVGFHARKAASVDAPVFDELPMALECRLLSYDEASGALVGEIVNVSVSEEALDGEGRPDPGKIRPIAFDTVGCTYTTLGEKVGTAFSDGKKRI